MNRYIIPILLVILSASVYVFVIDPTYVEIRVQQEKEAGLASSLQDAQQASVKLAKIKESYSAFPAGSEQALSTILPDKIDPVKFIVEMEAVARLHGLILDAPQVTVLNDANNTSAKYIENKLTFSVSAPYTVFHEFLNDVQDSLALRDMASIGFTAKAVNTIQKTQSPQSIIYVYNVSIISYSLQQ